MTSKRFVLLCVALLIMAFWLVSRPSRLQTRGQKSQNETVSQGPESKKKESVEEDGRAPSSVVLPNQEPISRNIRRPVQFSIEAGRDMHSAIRRIREERAVQSGPKVYKDLSEVVGLRAAPNKAYSEALGAQIKTVGGYAIYNFGGTRTSLDAFDGTHLPVVEDSKSRLGIVNGNIFVAFNQYPQDVKQFAAQNDLAIAQELPKIKTVAFKPRHYPAHLVELVSQVKTQPNVKSADLEIVFRTPVVQ